MTACSASTDCGGTRKASILLSERNDSGRALRRLARGGVPMTALDQRGEEYRLNPLLRDMLAQELRTDDPDALTALHLRTSEWCEQHGDV